MRDIIQQWTRRIVGAPFRTGAIVMVAGLVIAAGVIIATNDGRPSTVAITSDQNSGDSSYEAHLLSEAPALGDCPAEFENVEYLPFEPLLLDSGLEWFEAREGQIETTATTTPADRRVPVTWVDAEKLGSRDARPVETPGPSDVVSAPLEAVSPRSVESHLYGPSSQHVLASREVRSTLYVGIDPEADESILIVAADEDGRVAFVGACHFEFSRRFAAFMAGRDTEELSARDTFVALVRDPDGETAREFTEFFADLPTPTFDELEPIERQVFPGDTPDEIVARLHSVPVRLDLPADWRIEHPVGLCVLSEVAWGECAELSAWPGDEQPRLFAYVDGASPLEIWFKDPDGPLEETVALAGRVPQDAVRQWLEEEEPVRISVINGIQTLEEALDVASEGTAVLRVVGGG